MRAILEGLAAEGRLIIITTHDLDAVRGLARQVVILRRGKVVLDEARDTPFGDLEAVYERGAAA